MTVNIDRMKDKHNAIVRQLDKARQAKEKKLDALLRAELKVRALIKAVGRSSKRLDKARTSASLNAPLPTAAEVRGILKTEPAPTPAPAPAILADDDTGIPQFLRRGLAAQVAVDGAIAKAKRRKPKPPAIDGLA